MKEKASFSIKINSIWSNLSLHSFLATVRFHFDKTRTTTSTSSSHLNWMRWWSRDIRHSFSSSSTSTSTSSLIVIPNRDQCDLSLSESDHLPSRWSNSSSVYLKKRFLIDSLFPLLDVKRATNMRVLSFRLSVDAHDSCRSYSTSWTNIAWLISHPSAENRSKEKRFPNVWTKPSLAMIVNREKNDEDEGSSSCTPAN